MRFASGLFVGVALLLVAVVAVASFRHKSAARSEPAAASSVVMEGNQAVVRRLEGKSSVTRRLLEGELTLMEAAAWFRYIDRVTGPVDSILVPGEEGESDEERLCRQVIRWAEAQAQQVSPQSSQAVVSRLEAQLDDRLRRDGKVELPEPH
ncbi:MAG TPA: hypothetical protein VMS17_11220 [Gemmataceae bacterium]|nr:hypothetical protein [Gemmataceae bacterium]